MPGQEHRIVAGIDGSPSSLSALRWAIGQAGLTGATVDAVITWHYPASEGGYGWAPIGTGTAFDYKDIAEEVLADAIAAIRDPGSSVPVRSRVVEGNAAQVLLDAADGADLLVVGSRGHGGFTEALLGSVSTACITHTAPHLPLTDWAPQPVNYRFPADDGHRGRIRDAVPVGKLLGGAAGDFSPCRPVSGSRDTGLMKSWFSELKAPAPGMTDDELPTRAIPVASRSCCCPASPAVTVVMPPAAARRHPVALLLCGHHYRASEAALRAAGATAYDRGGTLILPAADGTGQVPDCTSVLAGSHQVTR